MQFSLDVCGRLHSLGWSMPLCPVPDARCISYGVVVQVQLVLSAPDRVAERLPGGGEEGEAAVGPLLG